MSHLLLVEDDESLGQTLRERLELEGHRTILVESLNEARKQLEVIPFDLVILDVGLPDGSGFQFSQEVKEMIDIPFMFVTAQANAEDRLRGFELGAVEFIPKPFHLKEFFLRVKHVLEAHTKKKILKIRNTLIDFEARTITIADGEAYYLSNREFEILRIIIESRPNVCSRDKILDQVWGEDKSPSNRTIDNMIVSLRHKLGESVGESIRTVRGVGYQWIDVDGD